MDDANIRTVEYNGELRHYYNHEVSLSSVSFIFDHVFLDTDLDRNVIELCKLMENNNFKLMSFSKKFKQISLQFYEILLKQRDLYQLFTSNPCTNCLLREQHFKTQHKIYNVLKF